MQQNAIAPEAPSRTQRGSLQRSPVTYMVLRGPLRGGEWREGNRSKENVEEKGRRGVRREGRGRSWNRAADWLRPDLVRSPYHAQG